MRDLQADVEVDDLVPHTILHNRPTPIPTGLHTVTRANRVFPVEGEMSPSPDELAAGGCIITFRDVSVRLNEEQETMDVLVPLDLDQALSEMAAKQLKRGPSN